jgi:hypothetical protein
MIPSYVTRKMIWSGHPGTICVLAMIYALSCACDALLAKIQLYRLNSLIQLLLLLVLMIPSKFSSGRWFGLLIPAISWFAELVRSCGGCMFTLDMFPTAHALLLNSIGELAPFA